MSQSGVANAAMSTGIVDFLSGNSGGPVGPDSSNNINIVGAGGITVSGNAFTNTLTISESGVSKWNLIGAPQTLVSNQGYICTSSGSFGTLMLLLPPVSSLGDIIEITLDGAGGFTVTQGAGQSIRIGNQITTAGTSGSLMSTQQGDTLRMVCQIANLKWNVLSSMGNPIVM